jgi:hypothetical protein
MCSEILNDIETLLTIGAILFGGFWTYFIFIKNRERFPRAKLDHSVSEIRLDDKLILRLSLSIENIGKVILPVEAGEIWLQKIETSSSSIDDFVNDENLTKSEIAWQSLEMRKIDNKFELEPNEFDSFHFDFVIDNDIEIVQFYTHIENSKKKGNLGWNKTTIHYLKTMSDKPNATPKPTYKPPKPPPNTKQGPKKSPPPPSSKPK